METPKEEDYGVYDPLPDLRNLPGEDQRFYNDMYNDAGVPQEVAADAAGMPSTSEAPAIPQTGMRFDFGSLNVQTKEDFAALPDEQKELLRAMKRGVQFTEESAAKFVLGQQGRQQKMADGAALAKSSPAGRAEEARLMVDNEKRLIAMDEIKSVRKTITEMVGDGDKIPPHPGFSGSVGRKNYAYAFGLIPEFLGGKEPFAGTSEADFYPYLKQLEGGAFLRAFERIKGGGQITEIEGQKATEAIIRASSSQSEEGFKKSMKDFVDVISAVEGRMMETDAKRSGSAPATAQPAAAAKPQRVSGGITYEKGEDGLWNPVQ